MAIIQGQGVLRVSQDPNIDIVPVIGTTAELALDITNDNLYKWNRTTSVWDRMATSEDAIDPAAITVQDADFTLPIISQMGQVHVFRNPSGGGGPATVSADATNEMNDSGLGGSVNVGNGSSELFIATSAIAWSSLIN